MTALTAKELEKEAFDLEGLRPLVESAFSTDAPGGVVLVARGKEVLHRAAYGLADLESGRALTVADALPIGSITKSFTAGAILRLASQGRLALEDDVRVHVPTADTRDAEITIEQLLTHTSGLPNLVDVSGFEEWALESRSLDELLNRTEGVPLHFSPGNGFFYSDSGYILLGSVIQEITGQDYADFIASELFPLANLTGVSSAADQEEPVAKGWSRDESSATFVRASPLHMSVPHASGALIATVDDLHRWTLAWRDAKVAAPWVVRKGWQPRLLPDGTVSGYGYGWKRCTLEGHAIVGHGGWVPGNTATVLHAVDANLTAAVLVNNDAGAPEAGYLARRILRLLLTGSAELRTVELEPSQIQRLTGRYETGTGDVWEIAAEANSLHLQWSSGAREPLVAVSASELAVEGSEGTWLFRFDLPGDGKPARSVRDTLSCEPREKAVRLE